MIQSDNIMDNPHSAPAYPNLCEFGPCLGGKIVFTVADCCALC